MRKLKPLGLIYPSVGCRSCLGIPMFRKVSVRLTRARSGRELRKEPWRRGWPSGWVVSHIPRLWLTSTGWTEKGRWTTDGRVSEGVGADHAAARILVRMG